LHQAGIGVEDILILISTGTHRPNKTRDLIGVFAGNLEAAHDAGCRMVEEHVVVSLDERADLVITTGAGLPLDATFIQSIKGLEKAQEITRPGGKAILIAECSQGLGGETFAPILDFAPTPEAFSSHYSQSENFTFEQWAVHVFYRCKAHFDEISLYSPRLPVEDFQRLGVTRVENLQETVDRLTSRCKRVVVVPEGPYVLGRVQGD
jgi:nickel-dependent lactate racemase